MAKILEETALTFDDVLLVPQYSEISSRYGPDLSTGTCLGGISLSVPVLSANMDTVTEWEMAEAMARLGGLGIIHRFMSIEEQVRQVEKVKRADNTVIRQPIVISPQASVGEARDLMESYGVGGIMVTDEDLRLLGVLTKRDALFRPDEMQVRGCMTPREDLVVMMESDIPIEEAKQVFMENRLEKLPLINEQGKLVGLVTAKDIVKQEKYPDATRDEHGNLVVGAAVGTRPEDIERCEALQAAGVDIYVVDIAHGHSKHTLDMIKRIRQVHPQAKIVAGNVATYAGTLDLLEAGADVIKVGVGSGSICITRIVTGFGVPQLSAIMESARACQDFGAGEIIADGGIRRAGDMVKALAAGAHAVMVGSMVSGTDEAPGFPITKEGKKYKAIRGMASFTANIERKSVDKYPLAEETFDRIVPEGVEAIVPYRGSVREILYQMVGGLRSGLSYAGAHNLEELRQNAAFVRITSAGRVESGAHDVELR